MKTFVTMLALMALPVAEWVDDLTRSERVHRALLALVVTACAVALLVGCRAPGDTRPGSPVEIDVPAEVHVTTEQTSAVIVR
ncbi:hypothetical protein [Saccharothrix lopnurensis]|uniref:Uncharacterized protein n=1 Tax=Saccharothrix lopnurensis TaxID=1670621 RepID=A0ABW1P6D8_9PSEU